MFNWIGRNKRKAFLLLLLIFIFMVLIAITLGTASMSIGEAFYALIKPIPILGELITDEISTSSEVIIYKIRLPRILMASLVGMGLSVVGTSFQAVFRNPMADPYVLGISSGGALGAAIAMLLIAWGYSLPFSAVTIFAFAGALITSLLVYNIARVGNSLPTVNLLLAGIAISYLLSACLSILMVFNSNYMERIVFWTLGSFNAASYSQIGIVAPVIFIGSILMYGLSRDLNLMLTGEESAKSMGIEVEKVKKLIIIIGSLIVAAAVAFSGVIGFVGLLVPHMLRMILGPNHKSLIPFSALGGALFLLFSDTAARAILPSSELPVGAVTALIGAPYFIFLFLKYKKRGM